VGNFTSTIAAEFQHTDKHTKLLFFTPLSIFLPISTFVFFYKICLARERVFLNSFSDGTMNRKKIGSISVR